MSGREMDAAWRDRRIADLRDRLARWDAAPGDGSGYRVTVPLPELRAVMATLATPRTNAGEVERLREALEANIPVGTVDARARSAIIANVMRAAPSRAGDTA